MDPESKEEDVYLATFRAKATVAVAVYGQTLVDIFNTAATRRILPDWINLSFFWASAVPCLNLNPLYEKPVRVARSLPSSFPFSRLCPTQVNPLILIHVK